MVRHVIFGPDATWTLTTMSSSAPRNEDFVGFAGAIT